MYRCLLFLAMIFGFPQGIVLAADYERALLAMDVNDYKAATEILLPLAKQGDSVAAYDLSLAFVKLNVAPEQAADWLKRASRAGLVNAYNRLRSDSIRPAVDSHAIIIVSPEDWIREQEPSYYTLQLASSKSRNRIEKYYSQNKLQGKAGYYRNRRKDQDWYALVYGTYVTQQAARSAADNLPENLRQWSPWIRRMKDIQRIMQPLDMP
ncbi:MAG: SPOR domain-containing protein [Proteobacteria bacterium]|jgi:septal ring-binding cell division protein DamX|nr:SPOR domain-containing protein [Pseudomonadota bacterium]MCG6936147.1 SPOR domain-containing protein [Pseudomonadota bacterium]